MGPDFATNGEQTATHPFAVYGERAQLIKGACGGPLPPPPPLFTPRPRTGPAVRWLIPSQTGNSALQPAGALARGRAFPSNPVAPVAPVGDHAALGEYVILAVGECPAPVVWCARIATNPRLA